MTFHSVGNFIIPTDFHIFQGLTPPTSSGLYNGDLMVMVIFHGDWDHFQLGIPLVVYQ